MAKNKELMIAGTDYIAEIPSCNDKCPVYNKCNYDRRARLCGFRYELFRAIASNLREIFPDPDARIRHYIDFALIPLYNHLISLRLEIRSYEGILVRNKMGNYANSYKELRETMKQIMNTLKEMGIKNMGILEGFDNKQKKEKMGDGTYYSQLLKRNKKS